MAVRLSPFTAPFLLAHHLLVLYARFFGFCWHLFFVAWTVVDIRGGHVEEEEDEETEKKGEKEDKKEQEEEEEKKKSRGASDMKLMRFQQVLKFFTSPRSRPLHPVELKEATSTGTNYAITTLPDGQRLAEDEEEEEEEEEGEEIGDNVACFYKELMT
ncbi:unnamed protein product [Taenia asiatica]|uniref:Uncharacterized protein n=1 Tax=Taenia asiatica TaxID=60517 RepID=A0A0R3WG77_TAEAS|nr:unnamed protein product [Taenia asiatica]